MTKAAPQTKNSKATTYHVVTDLLLIRKSKMLVILSNIEGGNKVLTVTTGFSLYSHLKFKLDPSPGSTSNVAVLNVRTDVVINSPAHCPIPPNTYTDGLS